MEKETLFDIFKIAIDREREAYEFYLNAAAGTNDAELKSLFEEFAGVELGHEKKLRDKYRELRGTD